MLVVIIEPEEPARKKIIENSLESMQGIVGGYIEAIPAERMPGGELLKGLDLLLVLNEEGKLLGLKPNFPTSDMGDIIVGTAFVCKSKGCEMVGLSDDEADLIVEMFYRKEEVNG